MADPITILAAPIVDKITKETYKFGKEKYNDVYGVKDEIENLQSNLKSIAAVLTDAERCSKKPKQLIDWLTKLRGAALDVEDILETYATEAALRELKNHPAPIAWLGSRLNAANDIKRVVKRIDVIDKEKKKFHIKKDELGEGSAEPATWLGMRERDDKREGGVVGRDKEKEEIVTWLLSHEYDDGRVPVFTITGMGGLGKTTLAQLAYNDEKVFKKKLESSFFKNASWVNVAVDFSVDRILKEIIQGLTEMDHANAPQDTIKSNILKVLDGNPFLLVLDDVWISDKTDWEGLHTFLRSCPRGSKVLVTSRNHDVGALMGAARSCPLETLPEELCWSLFTKELCLGDTTLGEEEMKIGKDIIKKCNQLPLAVKAMAAIMRGKRLDYWIRISKNSIWAVDEANQVAGRSNILPALLLSYDHLPSSILKQCFAYCSIFPKTHLFDKRELVKLWIAEGYILHPSSRSRDTLEDVGGDYFDELQSRSFFQLFVDNEKYKMHDLILELAQHVSVSSQQLKEETVIQPSCLHASFLCEDVQKPTLEILKAQKLRTLLLPSNYTSDFGQSLNKIFQTLKYMRVLDLSSTKLVELPKSIKKLKLLHFLDLSRTEIRLLPNSVCKLLNLQILKLLGCLWLQELPKDLGNLKDLRFLELDEMFWYKCSKLPPGLGGLTNLRNLHRFHVHRDSGYGIEELKRMKSLQGVLHISKLENSENSKEARLNQKEYITTLKLEWSKEDASPQDPAAQEHVLEDLEPHHGLQELQILQYKGSRLPNWMSNGVLQNLNKISLKHCVNCKTLSFGPLPHLQQLIVKGMLELEEWPETTPYLSLRYLTISNCPKLQNLPHSSFMTLQVMKIKHCHALKALPVTPYLMFLTLINNDLLKDWSEILMMIVVDRSHEGGDILRPLGSLQNHLENNNTLQRIKLMIVAKSIGGLEAGQYIVGSYILLLELNIVNCPRLQKFPESFAPQKLKISGCPLLTTLPNPDHSQRLQNLELDKCNGTKLIEAIQSSNSLAALTISNITNMTSLPKLPHLPTLRTLYIHNCKNLETLSHEDGLLQNFTSLKFLSVSGCENLVEFPEQGLPTSIDCLIIKNCSELQSFPTTSRNYLSRLTSLKDLYLEDCHKFESLPEEGLPASLQHLRIRGCPLLTEQCNEDAGGTYCQMISQVPDLEHDSVNTARDSKPFSACFTCK